MNILAFPKIRLPVVLNGDLAGYLIKYRYFGHESINISVEQGFEIMRPSILYHRASQKEDHISIEIGGKTIIQQKGSGYKCKLKCRLLLYRTRLLLV